MIAHARALALFVPAWCWAVLWWLWPRAAQADALATDMRLYDWRSLGYAALLGLGGGGLALIVSLATDRRVVLTVLAESARNAMVSPIAGAADYLLLKSAAALGWFSVATEPRFLLIVAGGWAGIAFFAWLKEISGKAAAVAGEWLINRGRT
jgi:hypothetical protein